MRLIKESVKRLMFVNDLKRINTLKIYKLINFMNKLVLKLYAFVRYSINRHVKSLGTDSSVNNQMVPKHVHILEISGQG